MTARVEIIQCRTCESTSFQIHRTGSAVTFICTTCGQPPYVRCPICEVVGGHAATCVVHSADPGPAPSGQPAGYEPATGPGLSTATIPNRQETP